MSDPNEVLQVQHQPQTQMAPGTLTEDQQPVQQFSEAEMLLRNMEDNVGIKRKGDVADRQDREHGTRRDRPAFLSWLLERKPKKVVARLTKEERRETRSDVQRLEVKTRLGAIANRYARDRDVKRNAELFGIIQQIQEYSKLDAVSVKHEENLDQESELYAAICQALGSFVLNECMKHERNTGKLVDIGVRLHTFFSIRGSGSMAIPESPPAQIIEEPVRAPLEARSIEGVTFENFQSRPYVVEKNVDKRPLFPHEPSINDIKQQYLGDCYFLAALGSIVTRSPQAIKDCMKDDGVHHVYVRFYTKTPSNTYSPIYVKTEKKIPQYRNGTDMYAGGALWVQMMERAYATVRSKYITGEDRFGFKAQLTDDQAQMRLNMHTTIKNGLKMFDDSTDPQEVKAKEKEEFLEGFRYEAACACMFDENGRFIENFDDVSKGMTDASYMDIAGGHSSEVYEAIMGQPSEHIKIEAKNERWAEARFRQNLHEMRLQTADGAQNPQTSDEDVMKAEFRKSLTTDTNFAQRQSELRQIEHDLIAAQRTALEKQLQDLATLEQAGQAQNAQNQAEQTQSGQAQNTQTQAGQTQTGQTQAGQAQTGQTQAGQAQTEQAQPTLAEQNQELLNKEREVAQRWDAFRSVAADAADYQDRQDELLKAQKELIDLQQDTMIRAQRAIMALQPQQQGQNAQAQNNRVQIAQARAQIDQANPELAAAQRREADLRKKWGVNSKQFVDQIFKWDDLQGAISDEVERSDKKDSETIKQIISAKINQFYGGFRNMAPNSAFAMAMQMIFDMASRLFAGVEDQYPCPETGKYGVEEEEMYSRIQTAVSQKKLIGAATRNEKPTTRNTGLNGEAIADGVIFQHSYTILGVEERKVDLGHGVSHTYKFIKLRNPWGTRATKYVVENGKMHTAERKEEERGRQGFFLMELHDFMRYFSDYYEQ